MPEKKDSANPGEAYAGNAPKLPTQESVDMLIRLLQEFERRTSVRDVGVPPEVQQDIDVVTSGLEVIQSALALEDSPMVIDEVEPATGPKAGGQKVTIEGSHFVAGATVRFGDSAASSVKVLSLDAIEATTPPIVAPGTGNVTVNVVVDSIIGSAVLRGGYTYSTSATAR